MYVCGCYEDEKDFIAAYEKELKDTKNIISKGFVDIWSNEFKELSNKCSFTLLPSCAEGCAGTIATCMSAGIVPICSRICGYDEDEVITLKDCKKDTIKEAIINASNMKMELIEEMSRKVVELTKTKYSIENFERKMYEALHEVLCE